MTTLKKLFHTGHSLLYACLFLNLFIVAITINNQISLNNALANHRCIIIGIDKVFVIFKQRK